LIPEFLNISLFVLLETLLTGKVGAFSEQFLTLSYFFILLILISANLKIIINRWRSAGTKVLVLELLLIILVIIAVVFSHNKFLRLGMIPIFIIALYGIKPKTQDKADYFSSEAALLLVTSVVYFLAFLLLESIPAAWILWNQASNTLTNALSRLIGAQLLLGSSVSGLYQLLYFLIFSICAYLTYFRNLKRILLNFIFLFLSYMTFLSILRYTMDSAYLIANAQLLFLPLGFASIMPILIRKTELKLTPMCRSSNKRKAILILSIALAFFGSTLLFVYPIEPSSSNRTVLLYGKSSLLDWESPQYGRYTLLSSGMYGLLPKYLKASGYETITIQSLDYEGLSDAKVLIMILPDEDFSQKDKERLKEWINTGGSLLLLADHTDIGGFMSKTNSLLEPFNIKIKFDIADPVNRGRIYFPSKGWFGCLELKNHPINYKIENSGQIQIGGGASLAISAASYPIIVGSYGFSDPGDYSNYGRGAYLGNRNYDHGEQFGDAVLAAGSYYGKGKVIVFGDTSSFQNSVLCYNFPFLNNIFAFLSCDTNFIINFQYPLATLLLIGSLSLLIFSYTYKGSRLTLTALTLAICLGILLAGLINARVMDMQRPQAVGDIVYIDSSHLEQIESVPFQENSVDGLSINLQRNGFLPILLRDFDDTQIIRSKMMVFIAPTQIITATEINFLESYMNNGGFIILASGFEEKAPIQPLLEKIGFDIAPIQLGPLPLREMEEANEYFDEPKFINAWPITYEGNEVLIWHEAEVLNKRFPIIAFKKIGKGGVVLIADSEFLLNKNIETEEGYWEGNIMLLKRVFEEIKGFLK
jgi:hypothetical protein